MLSELGNKDRENHTFSNDTPFEYLVPVFLPKQSNAPSPEQVYSIKPPIQGMDFTSNPRLLPALPPHGTNIDKCKILSLMPFQSFAPR